MLGILLKKEWQEHLRTKLQKYFKKPLTSIINLTIVVLLMVALLYIFIALNKRFALYQVANSIFILTLFGLIILQMILHLNKFTDILFEPVDNAILATLPVSKVTIIWSKIILFYLEELVQLFVLLVPIIIAYGVTNQMEGSFYFIIIPILLLLPIFICALSLIFAYPFYFVKNFLKNQYLLQLILIVVVIGLCAFIYQDILELFIGLVGQNRLSYIFNTENAEILAKLTKFAIPCNIIVNFKESPVINSLLILLMTMIEMGIIYGMSHLRYRKLLLPKDYQVQKKSHHNKISSPSFALIKKEYLLMFRSTNQIFSYGSLLILLPVFTTIIINSLQPLIVRLLGNDLFFPFVLLIVTMLSCIVNSFGSLLISREGKNIGILKLIPVSAKKQINIKLLIALVNAGVSLLVTVLTLVISKSILFSEGVQIIGFSYLLIGLLLTFLLKKDLKETHSKNSETNLILAILFSLLIPLLFFILSLAIIVVGMPEITLWAIIFVEGLLFALNYYNLLKNVEKKFVNLGVNQ